MWRYQDDKGAWIRGKDHLHFGIQPGNVFLNLQNWGIMNCPTAMPVDPKGYVDPIEFIDTHPPGPYLAQMKETPTPSATPTFSPPPTLALVSSGSPWIAYIGLDENLWLVHPDNSGAVKLTSDGKHADNYSNPTVGYSDIKWSLDGTHLGVIRKDSTNSILVIINLNDSSATRLANIGDSYSWLPDGKSIVYDEFFNQHDPIKPRQPSGLSIINMATKEIISLYQPRSGESFEDPIWAPKGTSLFFKVWLPPCQDCMPLFNLGILDSQSENFVIPQERGFVDPFCSWDPKGKRIVCGAGSGVGEYTYSKLLILSKTGQFVGDIGVKDSYENLGGTTWSPDGESIAYVFFPCCPFGKGYIEITKIEGNKSLSTIRVGKENMIPIGWSPDSKQLLALQNPWEQSSSIVVIDVSTNEMISLSPGKEASWQPVKVPTATNPGGHLTPTQSAEDICPGAAVTRVAKGKQARVTYSNGQQVNVRSEPGVNSSKEGTLPEGAVFTIIDGPICKDDLNWWKIRTASSFEGWVAEGEGGAYYIEPWQ
jgi:hypothetical protein